MAEYREIHCPYGDDFEGGDECDRCEQYELCMETYPPVNLIEIPKGATNGDMIKAMFPKIEIYTDVINEIVDVEVCEDSSELRCFVEWWDAPYESEVDLAKSLVKSIPLDKVKQAREEIEQAHEDLDGYDPQAIWDYVSRVDEILDRLIESEEK